MSIFEIEIGNIFSVFAIWFCIYTCLRSLNCMSGCIQKINVIFEIEIASFFSVFAIWFILLYLPSFFVPYGCLYSETSYGRTDRIVKH